MSAQLVNILYLVSAVLFVLGIKGLTKPKTAVRGNILSATGMLIAILVTLTDQQIVSHQYIITGMVIGAVIGATAALRVQMTGMPEMVALFNGFGGGASLGLATTTYLGTLGAAGITSDLVNPFGAGSQGTIALASIGLTVLIGGLTLTGSLVAFVKLREWVKNSYSLPGGPLANAILGLVALGAIVAICMEPGNATAFWVILGMALVIGLCLVFPIGGADMPVVISLLNSYSGIAAAFAGFILGNTVLIVSGSLVGASGIILTRIMCVAMNRSLVNVLFGRMGEGGETVDADEVYAGKVKSTSPEEVAMLLETAQRVVIVPGYGMAVAQAQHTVRELADVLEERGAEVEYAIHPVAGRMPGHMNVLLAEAEVDYDKLVEMEAINPTFEQTDVAIVIGANDVTNPMAREDKGSPIYGMPILHVDKAKTVVVVKRSLSPGFAGLPNPLFALNHSLMLFGDGKKAIHEVTQALKE